MRLIINILCLIFPILALALPLRAQTHITFSHDGGHYKQPITLSIQPENTGNQYITIRYTINGNTPDSLSTRYVKPLLLDEHCITSSAIYKIQNAPDEHWYKPDNVEHIIVVRAAAFDKTGHRISDVVTQSYIIESLLGRRIRMPIVSVCVDSADLFDNQNGIFIPGADFCRDQPKTTGNYYRSGRAAERVAHFEYIDGDEVCAQDCGLRTHGHIGRRYAQKGLSLYARNEYGKKNFRDIVSSEEDERLVLRPFVNAWTSAGIQDYFCQQIASGLNFDALHCRPVVLFLNGEYWGIYYLEQKPDEKFVGKRHGYDPDSVRLVRDWAGHTGDGIDSGFVAMMQWLKTADLTEPQQYAKISELVDLESFTDYVLFETFIGNRDWPANNMRCWSAEGSPWRFIFFDGDAVRTAKFNAVKNALRNDPEQTYPASPESTLLLRKLLENKDFKAKFLARMKELQKEKFRWSAFSNIDAETASVFGICVNDVESEIAAQSARFGNPTSTKAWKWDVRRLRKYFKRRTQRFEQEWLDTLNGERLLHTATLWIAILAAVLASAIVIGAIWLRHRKTARHKQSPLNPKP